MFRGYKMSKVSKYKRYCGILALVFIFSALAFSIISDIIEIYAVSSMERNVCVPIIMYHHVKNTNLGKDVITPYEFEDDLKYLAENNYSTITMTQLINYVYEDEELPENPIILSFDDGLYSTYRNVFPLLKKYDMKIVLSIVGKSIDDFSKVNDTNVGYAHSTWTQLQEMVDSGLVEVQNHSYDLHKVRNGRYGCYQKYNESLTHYEEFLAADLLTLQERAKEELDYEPNTFTYPYGKFNDNTDIILKKLGFKATLSVKFGVNLITKDPEKLYDLKRICRSHNQGIKKLLKQGMETLRFIEE
jgi:peptidoglycan/xylan/chitin deacetylase (PgdA/CDA1 family)